MMPNLVGGLVVREGFDTLFVFYTTTWCWSTTEVFGHIHYLTVHNFLNDYVVGKQLLFVLSLYKTLLYRNVHVALLWLINCNLAIF